MKAKLIAVLLTLCLVAPLLAYVPARGSKDPSGAKVRFAPVHVYLDPAGKPLAAYQFELVCSVPARASGEDVSRASRPRFEGETPSTQRGQDGRDTNASRRHYEPPVKIVGVEGGAHPAFREAPYYDPAALMNDRIIIAAFHTGKDLPSGRTRIATIHLQVPADAEPRYELKLTVAADANGGNLPAKLNLETGETK
ncbi:MAG: hypothetical protein FJ280_29770 [Planctomycetes bacterium]|nr:hypothetical protein [Planctomycetota bacterium]